MDRHLLAILEESEDSDFDSEYDFPTVVSGLSDIQSRGDLVNQARVSFKDKIFRPGIVKSARISGDTEKQGLISVEVTTQTQTTTISQPLIGRDIPSSLGAIPRRQEQSKTPKTQKKAPQVPSTPFQGDLEIRDFYAEDTNPAGSYYTPDSKSLGWTAPFEKKLRELLPRAFQSDPPINPDFSRADPPPYDQSMAEGWGDGWGNDDLFNLENPAELAGQNTNVQQNVTEGGTPVTTTTTSVNTPATTLITTTEQFSDSASAYTSVSARQLAHEEE